MVYVHKDRTELLIPCELEGVLSFSILPLSEIILIVVPTAIRIFLFSHFFLIFLSFFSFNSLDNVFSKGQIPESDVPNEFEIQK